MKPALSVIVVAVHGHRSVRAALDAWQSQTCRDRLEIVLLCPDAEDAAAVAPGCRAIGSGTLPLHQARAAGVRAALADTVFIAEDHCLPEPDCAERLLDRMEEGWDAVGPALAPGTATAAAEASFLLGYGEWMPPVTAGQVAHLPGHNAAVPRRHLLTRGELLGDDLLIGAFLMRRLGASGLRFFLEPAARMTHYDPPGYARALDIFTAGGIGFGAVRTERWSGLGRAAFALAFPAVAAAHWLRASRQQLGRGSPTRTTARRLLAAIPLALAWGIGEAVGGLIGRRRAERHAWRAEVKPVTPDMIVDHVARVRDAG